MGSYDSEEVQRHLRTQRNLDYQNALLTGLTLDPQECLEQMNWY
jgi:hypothetical protein